MAGLNQLLAFGWKMLTAGGFLICVVGIIKWISGGKSHDAQQQESASWTILLGGAMAAIGLGAGASFQFPTF